MNTVQLVILAYILLCVIITVISSRRTNRLQSGENYILAGRTLPWLLAGVSVFGTTVGGTQFVGLTGNYYTYGMAAIMFSIARCVTYFTEAMFIAPKVYPLRITVMNDLFAEVFHPRDTVLFGAFQFYVLIGIGGAQIMAGAVLLPTVFPSLAGKLGLCLIICAVFFGVLTFIGGFFAVSTTNALHTFCIVFCALLLCIVGIGKFGGLSSVLAAMPKEPKYFNMSGQSTLVIIGWFLSMACQGYTGQTDLNAMFSARSPKDSRKAFLFNAGAQLILGIIVIFIGMLAVASLPGLATPNSAFSTIATNISPFFGAIAVAAVFAATASTATSCYLATAGVMAGWWNRLKKNTLTEKQKFAASKICTVICCVVAYLFSLLAYDLLTFAINLLGALTPFSIILVFMLYKPSVLRKSTVTTTFCFAAPVAVLFQIVPAFAKAFSGIMIFPLLIATVLGIGLPYIFDKRRISMEGLFRTPEEMEADRRKTESLLAAKAE